MITVAAIDSDHLAVEAIKEFVENGKGLSRRPRTFAPVDLTNEHLEWTGIIEYGEGSQSFPVTAIVAPSHRLTTLPIDWLIVSAKGTSDKTFTCSPRWLRNAQISHRVENIPGRRLAVFNPSSWEKSRHNASVVRRNIANNLGAEITSKQVFQPFFLQFFGGPDGDHFGTVAKWVQQEKPIQLISACCLNADELRSGIVDRLSPEITDLLCSCVRAAFDRFPIISGWHITTFGPEDFDWLGDLGISKVLLPYMWNKHKSEVLPDMERNFALVEGLVNKLNQALPFPVTVGHLSDSAIKVDLPRLISKSYERSFKMLEHFRQTDSEPLIFKQLPNEEEKFARLQQEAFLYLLDTTHYGQKVGENRPPVLYIGLEVHGGYYTAGDLHIGPDGEFLPLAWLPQCVRQHWGEWTLKNQNLRKERERLKSALTGFGY